MQGLVISLRDDSSFDCGDPRWQLLHEGGFHPRPWTLMCQSDGGARASVYDNYECLDEALRSLAACAHGGEVPAFSVALPCGSAFRRPGRVGAEEVMSSLGWVYVRNFIGYMPMAFAAGTCGKAVRASYRAALPPGASLGEATMVGGGDGGEHWCADVFASCEGFVRYDALQAAASDAFAALGVDTLEGSHGFVARTNLPRREAQVFQFPGRRGASERPAA